MKPKPKPVIIEIVEHAPEPIQVERKVAEAAPVPAEYEKNHQPKSSRVVDSGVKREPLLAAVPSLDYIKRVVAKAYGISVIDIESSRRTQPIVRPRQIVCYLSATMTRRSLPAIGRALGDRDHTTILHARDKIARLRSTDPVLDMKLEGLKSIILDTFLGVPTGASVPRSRADQTDAAAPEPQVPPPPTDLPHGKTFREHSGTSS